MGKRVCYLHIGPHKTGTSSIQLFLKENRAELLTRGYLVPESGQAPNGAHRPLVLALCGEPLPRQHAALVDDFARELRDTPAPAVIISAEVMSVYLKIPTLCRQFFSGLDVLGLVPRLVLFPRNQPQLLNSMYGQLVKGFALADQFADFVRAEMHWRGGYSRWLDIAAAFGAAVIAAPFTAATAAQSVVPAFLSSIGLDPLGNTDIRRNEAAGPFTISVARDVRSAVAADGRLTVRQAGRCAQRLAEYLDEHGLADAGYCGLTTDLARSIEAVFSHDNEVFAQRAWGKSWRDIFACDMGGDYVPNDYSIARPPPDVVQQLRGAVADVTTFAIAATQDPALSIAAPWNVMARHRQELLELGP